MFVLNKCVRVCITTSVPVGYACMNSMRPVMNNVLLIIILKMFRGDPGSRFIINRPSISAELWCCHQMSLSAGVALAAVASSGTDAYVIRVSPLVKIVWRHCDTTHYHHVSTLVLYKLLTAPHKNKNELSVGEWNRNELCEARGLIAAISDARPISSDTSIMDARPRGEPGDGEGGGGLSLPNTYCTFDIFLCQ